MKWVFGIFLVTMLVILIPSGLALMVLDTHPHVLAANQISEKNIQRARQILAKYKPEHLKQNQTTVAISNEDLNLLTGYALDKAIGMEGLAARIHLSETIAAVYVTIPVPRSIFGNWINLVLVLQPHPLSIEILHAQIGRLPVPGFLAQWMAGHAHTRMMGIPQYAAAMSMAQKIQAIEVTKDQLALHFRWDQNIAATLAAEAKKQLFPLAHQQRLAGYFNYLGELSRAFPDGQTSLIHFIRPLFVLAQKNTAISRDPVAENTAVLQVLAIHAMGNDLAGFLSPEIRETLSPSKPKVVFLLAGRDDLAQHFLVSAAITIIGSDRLAGSMGLAKEMDDALTGSGFSFADMAVNRAGVTMGRFAVTDPVNARRLQQRLASLSHEGDFVPDISHLPKNMESVEFNAHFTNTQSTAYKQVMDEIDSRIKACRIYQN